MKQVVSAVAIHEAAHIVVGHHFGIKHKSVTIIPGQSALGITEGCVRYYHRPLLHKAFNGQVNVYSEPLRKRIKNIIVAFLSGPIAEVKFTGASTENFTEDHMIDIYICHTYLKHMVRTNIDEELKRLVKEAEKVVSAKWNTIVFFAEQLEQYKKLNNKSINAILISKNVNDGKNIFVEPKHDSQLS